MGLGAPLKEIVEELVQRGQSSSAKFRLMTLKLAGIVLSERRGGKSVNLWEDEPFCFFSSLYRCGVEKERIGLQMRSFQETTQIIMKAVATALKSQHHSAWAIMAILIPNTFAVTTTENTEAEDRFAKLLGPDITLGHVTSLFNHSCRPNAHWSQFTNERQVWFAVVADRPIRKGESVTFSYGPTEHDPIQSRQFHLKAAYGFTCQCPACAAHS